MTTDLLIGSRSAEHLSISVLARELPGESGFWDGNWVQSKLDLVAGAFRASIDASLRMDELRRLNEGLKFMHTNLFGSAVLDSMEDWIELTITCARSGELKISGRMSEGGNSLDFELPTMDQTYLGRWIAELDAIEKQFPVVGRP